MVSVEDFGRIVRDLLSEIAAVPYLNEGIEKEVVFDDVHGRYMMVSQGWQKRKRIHACIIHIDIIGDKVWIQKDNTDLAIACELERAGIPKSHIVLGFRHPDMRADTEYAVA